MLTRIRPHLSYSNVLATVALILAMGGGAYALTVPKDSVGAAQLKRDAVTAPKIMGNAVTGPKIRSGALRARHFAGGRLPAGAVGPQGPQGAQGAKGDTGAAGATNVVVRTQSFGSVSTGLFVVFRVMCETGERAVGGGAGFAGSGGNEELQQSYPVRADQAAAQAGDAPAGWFSIIKNNNASPLVGIGYAVCARP